MEKIDYIVTVKEPRNPAHNPQKKVTGNCPVNAQLCTDVTGEHHSFAVKAYDEQHAMDIARTISPHVTRIEVMTWWRLA